MLSTAGLTHLPHFTGFHAGDSQSHFCPAAFVYTSFAVPYGAAINPDTSLSGPFIIFLPLLSVLSLSYLSSLVVCLPHAADVCQP